MKKLYSLLCVVSIFFASMLSAAETCTLSGVFWMQHLNVWPAPFTPDSEICELTFSEIMETPSDGTPWYILAHEWIPAQLNVANGAVSECLGTALEDAEALLVTCDFSQNPGAIYDYLALTGALADYNNGVLTGCPGCPEGTIVICPPCVCPQCPQCPSCCCPPCPESPPCECGDCTCFCPEPSVCKCPDVALTCPEPAECGDCICPPQADCNCPAQGDCICNCPEQEELICNCPPAPACICPAIPDFICNCAPQHETSSSSCSDKKRVHVKKTARKSVKGKKLDKKFDKRSDKKSDKKK